MVTMNFYIKDGDLKTTGRLLDSNTTLVSVLFDGELIDQVPVSTSDVASAVRVVHAGAKLVVKETAFVPNLEEIN